MLECRNITKKYRNKKAVNQLSLQLEAGKVYALLGPNGSGKSTFMKMAAGLIVPTSGEILWKGKRLSYQDKSEIAYMPTESYFYPYMTWKDAGRYYNDFYQDFQMEQYQELLHVFSLEPGMKISAMSSGMAAKGKIALALARDAALVLLDEPLNGIDIIARDQILDMISNHLSPKRTFVISSHLVDELERMTDAAVFMKNGSIAAEGTLQELSRAHGKTITELYKEIYRDY